MNATYQLSTLGGLLSHFPQRLSLVRDTHEEVDEKMLWQARARSGDYLMTLATELDKLAQNIEVIDRVDSAHLERLVKELIYLNRDFEVTKKD